MIRRGEDVLGSWRVRPIGFRERHMRGGDYDTGWEDTGGSSRAFSSHVRHGGYLSGVCQEVLCPNITGDARLWREEGDPDACGERNANVRESAHDNHIDER